MQNPNKKYLILLYDNTLNGLLSAIFDAYRLKLDHFDLQPEINFQERLFQPILKINTNKAKANRIKIGLKRKTGQNLLPYLENHFRKKKDKEVYIYQIIKRFFEENRAE